MPCLAWMVIPIIKIGRSHDRLIFIMDLHIPFLYMEKMATKFWYRICTEPALQELNCWCNTCVLNYDISYLKLSYNYLTNKHLIWYQVGVTWVIIGGTVSIVYIISMTMIKNVEEMLWIGWLCTNGQVSAIWYLFKIKWRLCITNAWTII